MVVYFQDMELTDEEIRSFIKALSSVSPYDFSDYSEKSFRRRLEKVVNDNNCSLEELANKIRSNPVFLEKTVRDITVNTTEIFRDPKIWHEIQKDVIPRLRPKDIIRVWHAGCSSGQELYSMEIMLNENNLLEKTVMVGTDINSEMLEEAARGVYKYRFFQEYLPNFDKVFNINENKPQLPYSKYFDIDEKRDTVRLKPFLLSYPRYYKHDLVKEKNLFDFQFDLIICRNVLIYFNNNLQNNVFEMFWNNLTSDGVLIIGLHESIMGAMSAKYSKKGQLYFKKTLIS